MVNASVLKDLIDRHSKETISEHSNNFKQNCDKSNKKSHSKTLKPINHRTQPVLNDVASHQAKSKVVVKLPKPVSAQRSAMYKTSSSEIGKRLRNHQMTGSSDRHKSASTGRERFKSKSRLENAQPDRNRPLSRGTMKAETIGGKHNRDTNRNVNGGEIPASKPAHADQFNDEKAADMTQANRLVAVGATRNVTDKRVPGKPDEMCGSMKNSPELAVHDQDIPTPKRAAFEIVKDG